ncbi:hypothetical protein [Marinilabilia rubra]|uniref:HPr kinase/phosphorylase C-terminal domain-containing protein n=1 Tax=Marinilabilia rubra TaxID=2162893 RepID=A0A2U2B600_9BACT|nr:hypothetical protein [Marinilabilia rubra]PWD98498.1 hypothetical protein DDZ16_15590 [Marinilabilia rubra]
MNVYLPGIKLNFSLRSTKLFLEPLGSALYDFPLTENYVEFHCFYYLTEKTDLTGFSEVLSGKSFEGAEIPYKWAILSRDGYSGIHVEFYDDPHLLRAFCLIDFHKNTLEISLVPKVTGNVIKVDPLFQPMGSILMVVMAHQQNDVIIHASGVDDDGVGRLFTAVSGTGKSTMAGIWKEKGAKVINDDRLWLHKGNDKWYIFNTPMPYYAQTPSFVELNEIFLIRQSLQNELKQLNGANAAMRFMANAIQHFYDKEMTGRHLDRILDIASKVPIYDCGFKPDVEVVETIRCLGSGQ